MKKLLLSMLLMATMFVSYAYPVYSYARIVAVEKLANSEYKTVEVIIDKEVKSFDSIDLAFKYLGDKGYQLVSSHVSNKSRDAHHFYTFMRKESD